EGSPQVIFKARTERDGNGCCTIGGTLCHCIPKRPRFKRAAAVAERPFGVESYAAYACKNIRCVNDPSPLRQPPEKIKINQHVRFFYAAEETQVPVFALLYAGVVIVGEGIGIGEIPAYAPGVVDVVFYGCTG